MNVYSAQILTEEVCRMELFNNDSRLLLVVTSHRNNTSISNTLVGKSRAENVRHFMLVLHAHLIKL